ncbi:MULTISPECIES: thioredoxin family protein [unclassified Xanthobacter]|uniref:thioredoxin family protein n=1 Tax=unclassified Xanthobacter TaxID=2623496 RepID=UPI001EE0FE02|nr:MULTISPECIES: thioredoxin family protein [unclassified Xanthobacter]
MRDVKVLGSGCKRCEATQKLISDAAARLGVDVTVEKVTDYAQIAKFGILSTPGVVIDGKVVHAGGVPEVAAVEGWLKA